MLNQQHFSPKSKTSQMVKANSRRSSDLYKIAMNIVMENHAYNLQLPEQAASQIVAKLYLRNGEIDRAEAIINKENEIYTAK